MKKMPCLFQRDFHERGDPRGPFTMRPDVAPGCEWVLYRQGEASVKLDGSACLVRDGKLYKRLDCKKDRKTGEYKARPLGAIPCQEPDEATGHWPHWVPVGDEPDSRWHREAWTNEGCVPGVRALVDGTYELCGPRLQGNPQQLDRHVLLRHGEQVVPWDELFGQVREVDEVFAFHALRAYLEREPTREGLVFTRGVLDSDGELVRCKIRRDDYRLPWPPLSEACTHPVIIDQMPPYCARCGAQVEGL